MRQVYDAIRKEWVAATPEELVRQHWLQMMVRKLNFPSHLIAVEKELKTLPHLDGIAVPQRRIDILCFDPTLVPLLLIECKDEKLSQAAMDQAISYNTFINAPFVAIVNQGAIRLQTAQGEMGTLPNYFELMEMQ